jgi:hypothetical protein
VRPDFHFSDEGQEPIIWTQGCLCRDSILIHPLIIHFRNEGLMKKLSIVFGAATLLMLLLVTDAVFAQGGTSCATAVCVTSGTYTSNNGSYAQQWYSYKPGTSGTVTITSCGYATGDTYVYLYSSCTSSLTSSDDYCSLQSQITYSVTANTQYYIMWANTYSPGNHQWNLSGPVGTCTSLYASPSPLNIGYTPIGGVSATNNFVVSGVGLSPTAGNITVTPSAPFEISTNSTSGFSSTATITLPYTGGTLANTTIYVRFRPTTAGTFNNNIAVAGGGATSVNEAVTGTTVYSPCVPQFYDLNLGSITSVTFGSMTHTRAATYVYPPYYDYTALTPIVVIPGTTYPLSVTWLSPTSYTALCYVYFDWNNNAILDDPGEAYYLGNIYSSGTPTTGSTTVTVPLTANLAVLDRMRVRVMNGAVGPCAQQYGEVQDYTINCVGGTSVINRTPRILNFTAEATGANPANQNIAVTTTPTQFAWLTTLIQSPAPAWFGITPTTGTGPATVVTSILRTNLPPATYQGVIQFSSSLSSNAYDTINYTVVPQVAISPAGNPMVIKFGCNKQNGGTFNKSIVIGNSGGHFNNGVLNWSASTSASELSVITPTGTENGNLTLAINASALAPGTYTRTVTLNGQNSVTGVAASNGPYTLNIQIEVEPSTAASQTQVVGTSYTAFANSNGQNFAQIKSNSGTIPSFTVNMTPCTDPSGMTRIRYVRRVYTFSGTGSSYNVDMILYYSANEAVPYVTNQSLLKVYRQALTNGSWVQVGGTANPTASTVTVTGVTAISGTFALAHTWSPKAMSFRLASALYDRASRQVVLQWSAAMNVNEDGFFVERVNARDAETGTWEPVGRVAKNSAGDYGFSEKIAEEGSYLYRVFAYDTDGESYESQPMSVEVSNAPTAFALDQNYPNPFNPATSIRFSVPQTSNVSLKVYDMFWREVATLVNEAKAAGTYNVSFDASKLPSGTYFYRMDAGNFTATHKMNLMK